jgi:hypothetical protein
MSLVSTQYGQWVTNPPVLVNARDWGGMQRSAYAVYAPGVNIVNGWVVRLARIPAGNRIRGGLIDVTNAFGAAGTQANLGFTGAAAALLANQPLAAAAQVLFDRESRGVGTLVPGPNGTDTDLILTVTGVVTPVATGRIVVYVDYVA